MLALVALVQNDMKKLVAYSSVAHMGFVTLGFFLFSPLGIEGGIIQMISHGFISGAMFLAIGVLYDRMHTRQISDFGGVIHRMPKVLCFHGLYGNGQLRFTSNLRLRWGVHGDSCGGRL
jgi:NADH-quinone oxidoreductase subunit M